MKYSISLPIVLFITCFAEQKALLPTPATVRTRNSSARFYSNPEESAFATDIKIKIQEDTTRAIKELEERKNTEIQVSQLVFFVRIHVFRLVQWIHSLFPNAIIVNLFVGAEK